MRIPHLLQLDTFENGVQYREGGVLPLTTRPLLCGIGEQFLRGES